MEAINPDVTVKTYHTFVTSENILDLVKEYDFIIDGTDNFPAKFLINDACVMAKKPFSHAGIIRFKGQLMTYVPGEGPCYRCVFKNPPPIAPITPACLQVGTASFGGGFLMPDVKDFYQFTTKDITIEDYVTGSQIKNIPIAV